MAGQVIVKLAPRMVLFAAPEPPAGQFPPVASAPALEFTRIPPPLRWISPVGWSVNAQGVFPRSSAMIAYWLLSGSEPAIARTCTKLSPASAGTRAVRTFCDMITSTYLFVLYGA